MNIGGLVLPAQNSQGLVPRTTSPNIALPFIGLTPNPAPAPKAPSGGGGGAVTPHTTSTNTTSSGGGSSGISAAQQQANAQANVQAAAVARAQANYNNGLAADMSVINQGIGSGAGDYHQSILDYFNGAGGVNSQQNTINASSVQNELSRAQGLQGVRDMISNGIQGGGVVLDNDNAGTSSAGEALARAYGIQGRQQASGVGNQYAQGQNTIANQQGNLDTAVKNFMTVDAPTKKADIINNIVSGANQTLTYLNAIAQGAGVSNLPAIQQQIDQVKAQATSALSAYDSELGQQQAANAPTSQEANQAKAQGLFAAGTAPAQAFNFTNVGPAQLQNTGPAASSLPIYIAPSNKNTIPATA